MNADTRIYVAGSATFLGNALVAGLIDRGYRNVTGDDLAADLSKCADVDRAFERAAPEVVIHAAGRSGGIQANIDVPADLMRDNLLATANVVDAAYRFGASRLLYIASSCCYPRDCGQPMAESALGTGHLEPTNAAYATAKLAGITLCEAYRAQHGLAYLTVVPANVYGPGEDRTGATGHVIGALLDRFTEAKASHQDSVNVWGTGRPKRDFLYIDDFVEACIFCLEHDIAGPIVNVGSGEGVTIRALAETIARAISYTGAIEFDATRPDGMPEKVLDIERIRALGWRPRTSLDAGLAATYGWLVAEERWLQGAVG